MVCWRQWKCTDKFIVYMNIQQILHPRKVRELSSIFLQLPTEAKIYIFRCLKLQNYCMCIKCLKFFRNILDKNQRNMKYKNPKLSLSRETIFLLFLCLTYFILHDAKFTKILLGSNQQFLLIQQAWKMYIYN